MKTTLRHAIAAFGLAIFTLSTATVQAEDYTYTTNDGTITITRYTGSGGAVDIPDMINGLPVTSIGDFAFDNHTSVTSVTIPHSVTNIDYPAFYWCTSLTNITVDLGNSFYSSMDGVLFNKSQTTLIQCPGGKSGSYSIPNSVMSIGPSAFELCGHLTDVTMGNGVTNLGYAAFCHCYSLANITIGNNVTSIGDWAFGDCDSLTTVTIPNSVTCMGDYAFCGCSSLTNITISNGVTCIGDLAFGQCSSLTSITIPDSVTNIGHWAFEDCSSLTSVTIAGSVRSIGAMAFWNCTGLTGAYFQGNAPSLDGEVFYESPLVKVCYLPGTIGWSSTFGGRPTASWVLPHPVILTAATNFGIQNNQFGFRISWATNVPVVVEASATLVNPVWSPVSTNTLMDGWSYFSDAEWTNHPARFYRVVSP